MSDGESTNAANAVEGPSLPPQLENLSKLIAEKPEALATGAEDLRRTALEATKYIFDLALQTEEKSRIIVNDLLTSIAPEHAPQTRSQKRKRGGSPTPEPETRIAYMRETPINQLFVDGMGDEQIWAQLELRAQNMCEVLDYALDGPAEEPESDNEDQDRKLKKMREALIAEGFDPEELEGMEFDDEGDEDEDEDSEDDEDEDEDDEEEESEEEEDNDDDGEDADLGEGVEELRDPSDEEEDEDEPEIGEPSFLNGGKRTIKIKPRKGGHPELDDGFFDLAAFNAEIEAAESKSASRGRLSKDDDDEDEEEEEDIDYFASVDDQAAFDEEDLEDAGGDLHYKDFFEPPSRAKFPKAAKATKPAAKPASPKGKVRFHEEVRVKKIKAKGKNLPVSAMFYEEEEEEEGSEEDGEGAFDENEDDEGMEEDEEGVTLRSDSDEEDEEGEEEEDDEDEPMEEDDGDAEYQTMERLKDDLFADEDDQQQRQDDLSTYEKRMAALREEIAALEAENVGKKDWTLMGEANSRSRPQNSLLEEDLEFERVMKSVPVITEEVVHSLEERIKARILENQFDDVVRRRPVDDKPFLPSRFFELQDTKSKQSLAEIYEDEYTAAQTGGVAGEDRDGKLKKEHQEIEKLWENICGKLDALCNAHFTPKAPKATITTVSNVAAATLESALPTTKATTTMLAPEEVYAPSASDLRARSELTPAEKRALRNKQKKAKKKAQEAIQKTAEKVGRPRGVGDVKRQKDAALKSLVKGGKGVTVVGKKSKEVEGKRGKGKS
ncbi:U3 small nucleolar ribonucleoprotein complex, subunit Mpp10 [Trametes polyzona]|nr:U3 small nucleolar ribonucleoprotein complex, subunit Mpp10 [Trametes polyzona]